MINPLSFYTYILPNWINSIHDGSLADEFHQFAVDDDARQDEHHVGKSVKDNLYQCFRELKFYSRF